jgi:tRNA-dihydrouridine synthase A
VTSEAQITAELQRIDGVMVGREAYHNPWSLTGWDARFFGDAAQPIERVQVESTMVDYMARCVAAGDPWSHVSRHMLGLWNGLPGARRWRQVWSDHRLKNSPPREVARLAAQARCEAALAHAEVPAA